MKIKVPLDKANRLINHGPIVLISSFYKGKPNVCTVAWNMPAWEMGTVGKWGRFYFP